MKIYIVSFQSKENNETKNTSLFWKRAVVTVGTAGGVGQSAPSRSAPARQEACVIFSGALSPAPG